MSALLELQKAVYSALNGDAGLLAMVEGVYNHVPQGTDFPYVVISTLNGEDISTIASHKERVSIGLNIYSDKQGAKEVLDIAGEVHRILHQQSLELASGYTLEVLKVTDTNARQLASGTVWLGQVEAEARVLID